MSLKRLGKECNCKNPNDFSVNWDVSYSNVLFRNNKVDVDTPQSSGIESIICNDCGGDAKEKDEEKIVESL